jgi:phospholipid/cholesterol/gamma-HCH transport system substrate-binding protein
VNRALRVYWRPFAAIIGLAAIALAVALVILANQRFTLPGWVPGAQQYTTVTAELQTAQALTPGQGQTVDIAGVSVGEVSKVELVDGRAVVSLRMEAEHATVYRDASILVRPKTGLNDMTLQLDPGTTAAGKLPADTPIPISRTLPQVNTDEILASLDLDTRQYLQLLLAGGAEGLGSNGRRLSAVFRRFVPTARDTRAVTEQLARRSRNVRRAITNFRALAEAVGGTDGELTTLVRSSRTVLASFAKEDARIREALNLAPGTLRETQTALGKADRLARELTPATAALRPVARQLAPALRSTQPFFRATEPVVRTQLRPFARDTRPIIRQLRPIAGDLAALSPDLRTALVVLNEVVNELAYNPPGDQEGYLFWLAWTNHLGASVFSGQDAHGPIRRGILLIGCQGLTALDQLKNASPQLGVLIQLSNFVPTSEACAQSAQAPAR